MSSPESALLPRDADFGYEVIEDDKEKNRGSDAGDESSSVSVADHYKGTPPLKGKKKRLAHRHPSESQQQVRSAYIINRWRTLVGFEPVCG